MQEAYVILEPVGHSHCVGSPVLPGDVAGPPAEAVQLVTLADYIVKHHDLFVRAIQPKEVLAQQDNLVTFGIVPDKPETSYGYIEAGRARFK